MPNDAKAEDKSKKPKKGRLVLLIGAMLALLGVVAAIFLSLQQNLLTVMSFNIHHDEGESMWSVEVEFTSDSDYGFYIYTTGLPPSNWDQTEYGHIAEGPGGELRFFFLGYRAYNVLYTIKNAQPDVVGLQEAFREQVQFIGHALNYGSYAHGRDGDGEGETVGILWNRHTVSPVLHKTRIGLILPDADTFWFSSNPDSEGSADFLNPEWGFPHLPRIASWVRLKIDKTGRQFYFFNTHFQNNDNAGDGGLHRMKSADLLMKRIKAREESTAPVVLTGDFNASPTGNPVKFITQESEYYSGSYWNNPNPMVDTYGDKHPDPPESNTGTHCEWSLQEGAKPSGSRIDYVFTQPSIVIWKANIVANFAASACPSDHVPVTAQLSVR